MSSLKDITKQIQQLVGVTADGIWGVNSANAVLSRLREATPASAEPETTPAAETEPAHGFVDLYPGDLIDEHVHRICVQVLNVFETGSIKGDYAGVSIYADGPNGLRQITYGRSQTTESGNLKSLLETYLKANPASDAASVIRDRVSRVGTRPYLVNDTEFIAALKAAGKEDIMVAAQDEFFDNAYFNPAYRWFHTNGFTLPLSMLVIYDSFIHSGQIRTQLRNQFAEKVPSSGGDEKTWISEYVKARRNWLANHSNKILRKTVYRMDTMQRAMKDNNWMLTSPVYANWTVVA